MKRSALTLIVLSVVATLAAAACVTSTEPGGDGGSGSSGLIHPPPDDGGGFKGPRCYYDDDCDWGSPDGGACVEETCVPHPAGWCLLSSLCPLPHDQSCASAYCDPYAERCAIFNSELGAPCGNWDAGKRECNGMGTCVAADPLQKAVADAGAD